MPFKTTPYHWLTLLLTNLVVHSSVYYLLNAHPSIESARAVVILTKLSFFLVVTFGVLWACALWRRSAQTSSPEHTVYRIACLVSVGLIIVFHSQNAHNFGKHALLIEQEISQIGGQLPKKIQQGITLQANGADHRTVFYEFQLTELDSKKIDLDTFQNELQSQIIQELCQSAQLKGYINNQISFRYIYRDNNSQTVFDRTFNGDACG